MPVGYDRFIPWPIPWHNINTPGTHTLHLPPTPSHQAAASTAGPSSSSPTAPRSGTGGTAPELTPLELAAIYRREGFALEDLRAPQEEHFEQLNIGDASRWA